MKTQATNTPTTHTEEPHASQTTVKPTLVLAPGFMTDYDMWSDVVPYFKDYNIMYVDFTEGTTLQELAASNLRRLPERFTLMGFSLGGYISRHMVYQAPERVEALILVGTSTRPNGPAATGGSAKLFRGMSHNALVRAVHTSRGDNEALITRLKEMGARLGAEVFARLSTGSRV